MSRLEISDLSFCVPAEKEIDIKGGLTIPEQLADNISPLLKRFLSNVYVDIESVPDGSEGTAESTVEKIEDKSAGLSGLKITSKDGKTKVSFLSGKNYSFASASSYQLSNS
jgi:hypothetical protein